MTYHGKPFSFDIATLNNWDTKETRKSYPLKKGLESYKDYLKFVGKPYERKDYGVLITYIRNEVSGEYRNSRDFAWKWTLSNSYSGEAEIAYRYYSGKNVSENQLVYVNPKYSEEIFGKRCRGGDDLGCAWIDYQGYLKMRKAANIIGNAYLTAKFNPRCAIGYKHIMSLYDENFGEE